MMLCQQETLTERFFVCFSHDYDLFSIVLKCIQTGRTAHKKKHNGLWNCNLIMFLFFCSLKGFGRAFTAKVKVPLPFSKVKKLFFKDANEFAYIVFCFINSMIFYGKNEVF